VKRRNVRVERGLEPHGVTMVGGRTFAESTEGSNYLGGCYEQLCGRGVAREGVRIVGSQNKTKTTMMGRHREFRKSKALEINNKKFSNVGKYTKKRSWNQVGV